jgi:hypothetical protein
MSHSHGAGQTAPAPSVPAWRLIATLAVGG